MITTVSDNNYMLWWRLFNYSLETLATMLKNKPVVVGGGNVVICTVVTLVVVGVTRVVVVIADVASGVVDTMVVTSSKQANTFT